jgi:hypothetical protein
VGGGDHVMVDLQRAGAAASALEGLRDALAQHVPAILTAISDIRGEGATLPPPTALQQLQGRSPQDAGEMRAAFRIAQTMNNQLLAQTPPVISGGKVGIGASWTAQSLGSSAAQVDAQALAAAETSKDKAAARAAILGVTQDLADHQGDTAYLTAFWSRSGAPAAAAGLAATLNRQDGEGTTLLSAQDQQILGTFGTALAAVTKAGTLDATTAQHLITAFAGAPDLWSAAMVFSPPAGAGWYRGKPPHGQVIPNARFGDWWEENMGWPVSQLPVLPGQPSGGARLPANPYNSKLLEDWWTEYGYRMGLADSLDGRWDTGGSGGTGSGSAG